MFKVVSVDPKNGKFKEVNVGNDFGIATEHFLEIHTYWENVCRAYPSVKITFHMIGVGESDKTVIFHTLFVGP